MANTLGLPELADAALEAQPSRRVAPRIRIERMESGWEFVCPYVDEDRERWEAMLFEAFGTRSISAMQHFLDTISDLTAEGQWDEQNSVWMPLERDFQAAVNMVNALDPQDEAQAAYAAQLVALHLSAMKLAAKQVKSYSDPRATAILAKTVRAYGDGMERLARLQGKLQPRQFNQSIQVVYVDKRSATINGGCSSFGDQPHATMAPGCAAVPGSRKDYRLALPPAGGSGQARLQDAWWQRLRRALWRS